MLRMQPVKLVISVVQMQNAYFSSGLTRDQLLRIRNDQKQLYGKIIDGHPKQSTENIEQNENESISSQTADLKALKASQACEFHWLIQRCNQKYVRIIRSKEVEIDEDISIGNRFNESPSNETT